MSGFVRVGEILSLASARDDVKLGPLLYKLILLPKSLVMIVLVFPFLFGWNDRKDEDI